MPAFAFMNGAAMGGGLEVALHCTYRTVSSGVTAIGLPEAFLGLVPGWGGTYLLPRLIGPGNALKVIIENALSQNRMLSGRQAFELEIADAIFEPADFLEESLRWAARVLTGEVTVTRAEVTEDWEQAAAAARFFADGKLHGAAPAPYRAIDLVAAAGGRSRDEGFAAEDEALADLIMSDELRASLYAFDLTRKRARRPAGAPDQALARPVTKVGIVGAGPDGRADRAAVRPAPAGTGGAHRPRPGHGSTPAWATSTARSASCWAGSGSRLTRRPGSSGWSPGR